MKKSFVAILCILGLSHCSHKTYTLESPTKQYIEVGSYGGFAGASTIFTFLSNGQRFKSEGVMGAVQMDKQELEKGDHSDFKELQKGLKTFNFKDMELDEVGNMTYFVTLIKNNKKKKIRWSSMDTAPQDLVYFYRTTLLGLNKSAVN